MTKGQLRFCKISLQRNDSSNYERELWILDKLRRSKHYDSTKTRLEFEAKFSGDYPLLKHRLYKKLLGDIKRLKERPHQKANCNPKHCVEEAEILAEMGLQREAMVVLERAVVRLEKVEDLSTEVQARNLYRRIAKQLGDPELITKRTDNEYRLVQAADKLATLARYVQINDRLFDYIRNFRATESDAVKRGVAELMEKPEVQDIRNASSFQAQLRYFFIWQSYYSHTNNLAKSVEANTQLVRLREAHPDELNADLTGYRDDLSNLIAKLTITKRFDDAQVHLDKMMSIELDSPLAQVNHFAHVELQYQLFYMNQGKFEEVLERERIVLQGIKKYGSKLGQSKKITLLYNLGVTHLFLDHGKTALSVFNRIRDLGRSEVRRDLQGVARLIRLLLTIEDPLSFPYYWRNSKRFFEMESPHYQLEERVRAWLRKYGPAESRTEITPNYNVLNRLMKPLVEGRILGAEEIQLYAKARVLGVTPKELMLNMAESTT